MKRWFAQFLLTTCLAGFLFAQGSYKMNFLKAMDKIPAIKTCEDAYKLVNGKSPSYRQFEELQTNFQNALLEASEQQSGMSVPAGMSPNEMGDMTALKNKLKNMTDEEKQQWAMQNAMNFANQQTGVNKDMNNKPVNDAVEYLMKLQGEGLQDLNDVAVISEKIGSVNGKYKAKKEKLNEKCDWALPDGEGEITKAMIEKSRQGYEAYKKAMLSIYSEEMNEKLAILQKYKKDLIARYSKGEEIIASTHYADDANQPSNKGHILLAHSTIGRKAAVVLDHSKNIFEEYSNNYFELLQRNPLKDMH